MFRVSALTGVVLFGLSAGAARAQEITAVGHFFNHSGAGCPAACPQPGCEAQPQVCLVAVPCLPNKDCSVKTFLDKIFSIKRHSYKGSHCASPCCSSGCPTCPPGCVPVCQPQPCAPACPPPPKYVSVPVKLKMLCRVPQPVPQCQAHCCVPKCMACCAPACLPGCVPAHSCGLRIFHKHSAPQCFPQPSSCPSCNGSAAGDILPYNPPAANAGLPANLQNSASQLTPTYPQAQLQSYHLHSNGVPTYLTSQSQIIHQMPAPTSNPYGQLLQSIQAAQERENRLLREMLENRQATQAVIRTLQASDEKTVETFEKLLQQMKGAPPTPTLPPAVPAPNVVAPPIPGTSQGPSTASPLAQR